jgi:hypothetical protein
VSELVLPALCVRHDLREIKFELGGTPFANAADFFDDWVFHNSGSH